MKSLLLNLILCFMFLQPIVAQTDNDVYLFSYFKGNGEDGLHLAYSLDGFKWEPLHGDSSLMKPEVGNEKLVRDPCIVKGPDGYFHMVWTASWKDKGIGYAKSKDLKHWSQQQFIPVMQHEPLAKNCWAPEINYDADKKEYLIYWATTIPDRFPPKDNLSEDQYDHRIYATTTKDFKTFTDTKLFYDQGFNAIDATIVKDGKQYLMFIKDERLNPPQKNLHLSTAANIDGPFSPPSAPITGSYWAEGPTALFIDGYWIVYFDKYVEGKFGAVRSRDLKIWEDISNMVSFPKGLPHGTAFKVSAADFKLIK